MGRNWDGMRVLLALHVGGDFCIVDEVEACEGLCLGVVFVL